MMEKNNKKSGSNQRYIDYLKVFPCKDSNMVLKGSLRKVTPKQKSEKVYTQVSSSRLNCKVSKSTHQSPSKPKHDRLIKTSVLNYLHKYRSQYDDFSTVMHTTKYPNRSIRSIEMNDHTQKSVIVSKEKNQSLYCRTHEVLGLYRSKCEELQKQKELYKKKFEKADKKIKVLEKSIKKRKHQRVN